MKNQAILLIGALLGGCASELDVNGGDVGESSDPLLGDGDGAGHTRSHDLHGAKHHRARPSGAPAVVTGNGIDYHGGPVMHGAVNVYLIWYGNWTGNSATTILTDLASHIGGSPYYNINTTYADNSGPVANSVIYAGTTTDNYSQGTSLSDAKVLSVVSSAITSGRLPKDSNAIYFVLTSQDVSETSGFCTQYCGWHTNGTVSGSDIKYAFVGNAARCLSACADQSVGPNGNAGADAMASILSHELEEATSDPDGNAWWSSSTGEENADQCAWTFGSTYTAANGALANVRINGRDYLIQQNWVNASGGYCAMSYGGCTGDADCNDGNACTDDVCSGGTCVHSNNTASCDDHSACTSDDVCANGVCAGTPISCDDGDQCTNDSCNAATGCVNSAVDCTGGNVCLVGSCDPGTGCSTTPVADGTACPGGTCQAGSCVQVCATFTGTVSRNARQVLEPVGSKAAGLTLQGTLSCPTSTDIDLYLQVQKTNGSWITVANSLGFTCSEATTYKVPATYGGRPFRYIVQWYSGAASSYSLQACEH